MDTTPATAPTERPWTLLLRTAARLIVGGVLLFAGATKVTDPLAMVNSVRNYQLLPDAAAQAVGFALPATEIVLGLLLILGVAVRFASVSSAGLMVAFIAGVASAWARGLSLDCGCFGGTTGSFGYEIPVAEYVTVIVRDTVLVALAALTAWRPNSPFALVDRAPLHHHQPATDPVDPE